jgi:hypothetical protein
MKCIYCGDELKAIPETLGWDDYTRYKFCKEGRLTTIGKVSLMVDQVLVYDLNVVKISEQTSCQEIVEARNKALRSYPLKS